LIAPALALLLGAAPARAGAPAPPSRPPEKNCVWVHLTDRALGVTLYHQKCNLGFRTVDFESSPREGAVFEVLRDTAPGAAASREPVIRVLTKTAEETIAAAIRRVALPTTPAARRSHCRAVPAKDVRLPAGHAAYVFAPDDEAAILKRSAGDVPEPPCGDLGMDYDSQSYFEYHPGENPRRFLFVAFGQEEHPDFDEDSLRLLPSKP